MRGSGSRGRRFGWGNPLMVVFTSKNEMRGHVGGGSRPRAFVPTMGALHRGHVDLIRRAREAVAANGEVVVSIFVNPLQFAPSGDYDRYPRPAAADETVCRDVGVDVLFRPAVAEMYAEDRSVSVDETALAQLLEGKSRPRHFRGVCTVVAKLFNIVQPQFGVFGEKDFQQLAIIRRMVRDLDFPVQIIGAPTVREDDGLACSSRNQYLSADERRQAAALYRALLAARDDVSSDSAAERIGRATAVIATSPLARIDYVAVADADTLQPLEVVRPNAVMLLAVFFGQTRLIDNIRLA